MYKTLLTLLFGLYSSLLYSAELEEGKVYRLTITAEVKAVGDTSTAYTAMKNNKFEVISKNATGDYIVKFDRIYTSEEKRLSSGWIPQGQNTDTANISGICVLTPNTQTAWLQELSGMMRENGYSVAETEILAVPCAACIKSGIDAVLL